MVKFVRGASVIGLSGPRAKGLCQVTLGDSLGVGRSIADYAVAKMTRLPR
jgi:hypothetical protein